MQNIGKILENQELYMSNVLSFRKKLTQHEMQFETARIGRFIEDGGFTKTGPTVAATFLIEQRNGG